MTTGSSSNAPSAHATVTLTVGAPAHGGHCVARYEGRAVFVRHALPGEVVEAAVTSGGESARFWEADAVRILEASPDRVEHPWPEAGQGGVGGAELGHVALPAQRAWKLAVVREAFERFAHLDFPGTVNAAPGDDDRGGLGYRTRVSAVAGADGKASMAVAGSQERRRLTEMPLAMPEVERALLAASAAPGERIDVAVSSSGEVAIGSGKQTRNASLNERVLVDGSSLRYRVKLTDFWQVHREAPSLLANEVLRAVGDAPRVLDLYSGVGLLAGALAADGRDVTAVELGGPGGGASLEKNLASYPGAAAIVGDVRKTLLAMARDEHTWSDGAIVLDPPRAGAKAATVDAIAALDPARIVYVACDPVALARDAALLAAHGYTLEGADAWDLFPMTHHIETIATFVR